MTVSLPMPREFECTAKIQSNSVDDGGVVRGDVLLFSQDADVIGEMKGLKLRKTNRSTLERDRFGDFLYEISWIPDVSSPDETVKASAAADFLSDPEHWIIISHKSAIANEIVSSINEKGGTSETIIPGKSYKRTENGITLAMTEPDDWNLFFKELAADGQIPACGILYLAAHDSEGELDDVETLENAQKAGSGGLLFLLQALLDVNVGLRSCLWVVTQGIQPLGEEYPLTAKQAPLWGLGRTIAVEHPEIWGGLIDIDDGLAEETAALLVSEIYSGCDENEVAFRNGVRYISRLKSVGSIDDSGNDIEFTEDGTYLVTGGLGGIGQEVVKWMIGKDAQHLMLIGRNGVAGNEDVVNEWATSGIDLRVEQADVSSEIDLDRVFDLIKKNQPPLKGVIHIAGIFDDRVLARQDWDRFARVLKPKVSGGWNLHQHTKDMELDFFILFSSGASFLAPVGLGNYAAANAYLDSLSWYRHRMGLPAVSIDWGPWERTGMAEAVGENRWQQWNRAGFETLTSKQGLWLMERISLQGLAQAAVLPVDWGRYLANYSQDGIPPLYREIGKLLDDRTNRMKSGVESNTIRYKLEHSDPEESHQIVVEYVREQVTMVLGGDAFTQIDNQTGFFDLGMDSLTGIELKNKLQNGLGCTLPASLIFDYHCVNDLSRFLADDVLSWDNMQGHNEDEDWEEGEL